MNDFDEINRSSLPEEEDPTMVDEELDDDEISKCTCGHVKSRHSAVMHWYVDCGCQNFQYDKGV